MRTVGQDERQHHRLAYILAERQRRSAVPVGGGLRRFAERFRRLRQQRNQRQRRQISLLCHESQCIAGSSPSTLVTVGPLRRSSKRPSSPRPVTRSSLAESTRYRFFAMSLSVSQGPVLPRWLRLCLCAAVRNGRRRRGR